MRRNVHNALVALKELGCECNTNFGEYGHFTISGESGEIDGLLPADYYNEFNSSAYDDFGVHKKINKILEKNGLYAEWINPGMLGVWDE